MSPCFQKLLFITALAGLSLAAQEPKPDNPGVIQDNSFLIEEAHNFANGLQIVPGIAFLIGTGPSKGERAVFFYLSFEHSFKKTAK